MTESFVKGPVSWSDNLLPDSGGREESGGATEEAAEECLRKRRPRPQIDVILELISSKNTLPNGLADPLGMEKLEL